MQENFELLLEGTYGSPCLTQALTLNLGHELYLCTAGTDGRIAFWPLTAALQAKGITSIEAQLHRDTALTGTPPATPIQWTSRTQIHQNSIKSLTAIHLSKNETILATAGDDNALAFTRITASSNQDPAAPSCSTLLIPAAHAAAVTAVQYLGPVPSASTAPTLPQHRFATSGPDQRLKFWVLGVDVECAGTDGLEVAKAGNAYTSVADVACLDAFEGGDGVGGVLVAGIGVEVWRVAGGGVVDREEGVER